MGDMSFLVAGYAVMWLVSFVFIFSMVIRQRNIQKELTLLEQLVQEDMDQE